MAFTVKVRENGPYLVTADEDIRLIDWKGNAYNPPNPRNMALCRCGASENKPFCDGMHVKCGFKASDGAPTPSSNE